MALINTQRGLTTISVSAGQDVTVRVEFNLKQ